MCFAPSSGSCMSEMGPRWPGRTSGCVGKGQKKLKDEQAGAEAGRTGCHLLLTCAPATAHLVSRQRKPSSQSPHQNPGTPPSCSSLPFPHRGIMRSPAKSGLEFPLWVDEPGISNSAQDRSLTSRSVRLLGLSLHLPPGD